MTEADAINVDLPSELMVGKFAAARIEEILGLQAFIDEPRQGQAAAQQLPRHLRRRAVSHNPNRLPRRLRDRHVKEREKSGCNAGPSKRPSRKHRRRPKYLLQEYNRRQKRFTWLETHIWHAKRFHMGSKWGYKLAEFPNDKSFRACYRASAKKCLMQDISFFSCIELQGPESALRKSLSRLTPASTGSSFCRPDHLKGVCEGKILVYHPEQYPNGIIGQVHFLWRPKLVTTGSSRTLWIWSHPAFYSELLDMLLKLLGANEIGKENSNAVIDEPPPKKKSKKDVNASKMETRNVPFFKVPRFQGYDDITISLLKDTLNRIRLVGPLSQNVLGKTLKVSNVDSEHVTEHWWTKYYLNEEEKKVLEGQCKAWKDMALISASQLKPGTVLGLTVRDPRVILPGKRGGIEETKDVYASEPNPTFASTIQSSPIWVPGIRDYVTGGKVSDATVNHQRSECLIPGSELALNNEEARIPVLLVQQPGCPQSGFGSGWDLILPAGWGVSFWMNLVYQGARVGGLKEMRHLSLERQVLDYLSHMPDAISGKHENTSDKAMMETIYFSHPPDKRCNFSKIGITSPFSSPWPTLIEEYLDPVLDAVKKATNFFVLRDTKQLRACRNMLTKSTNQVPLLPSLEKTSLIQVMLELTGKGNVSTNSIICIPTREDFMQWQSDKKYAGPVEPIHLDGNEQEKKRAI